MCQNLDKNSMLKKCISISIVFSFSWELKWPQRNWKQCLCKILEWPTKSIMVCYFLEWSIGRTFCSSSFHQQRHNAFTKRQGDYHQQARTKRHVSIQVRLNKGQKKDRNIEMLWMFVYGKHISSAAKKLKKIHVIRRKSTVETIPKKSFNAWKKKSNSLTIN